MTSFRRTRSAILSGTKSLIAANGLQKVSMVEIADASEVSRATLYNHFRDKPSVIRALLEDEVGRIVSVLVDHTEPERALFELSVSISTDAALEKMRQTDPDQIALALTNTDDALWIEFNAALATLMGGTQGSEIARSWLLYQVLRPLQKEQSLTQSRAITQLAQRSM